MANTNPQGKELTGNMVTVTMTPEEKESYEAWKVKDANRKLKAKSRRAAMTELRKKHDAELQAFIKKHRAANGVPVK